METTYLLNDLGYGDGGKGVATHCLCEMLKAHTVVRTGGPQAFHSVATADGRKHRFSQFGSGSLAHASTHLSSNMLVDPFALMAEGECLVQKGERDIFERISVHENALVITPWQAITNRIREISRRDQRHGSVGIGVGETVADAEILGEGAIRVGDIGTPRLARKLEAIRELKISQVDVFIGDLRELSAQAWREYHNLKSPETLGWALSHFNAMSERVAIVGDHGIDQILSREGVTVFEPSQGVLLDRWHGFNPYTTMVNPKQDAAMSLISKSDYDGEIIRLGILRTYQTRHGAGPFVTEDSELTELLPDPNNGTHPWQGKFRVGQLDLVALRYAVEVSGGRTAFDGLVVSCVDQLTLMREWQVCDSYRYEGEATDLETYFITNAGFITGIKVRPNTFDQAQLDHQERLGQLLMQCRPCLTTVERNEDAYLRLIEDRLQIPIALASYGPTERDKKILSLL